MYSISLIIVKHKHNLCIFSQTIPDFGKSNHFHITDLGELGFSDLFFRFM